MVVRYKFAILIGLFLFARIGFLNDRADAQVAAVADAKAVLDLRVFPAVDPVGEVTSTVAMQSYLAQGDAEMVARKIDAALVGQGLKQIEGATFMPAYCSATYAKSGFHFILSVFPGDKGNSRVTLANLGNVDLRKLPLAQLGRELFVQPASAIFTCESNLADTRKNCRALLEQDGWEWFGETSVSFFMRKNAVRIQVMCSQSPAQQEQTMIQVSSEQMSSALPLIPGLVRIDYTDQTGRLDGDSNASTEEVISQLRQALEQDGWTATTKEPLKTDFRETFIFRNAQDEMVELSYHQVEGFSRFEMKYRTAEQVTVENELAQSAAEKAQAKMAAQQDRLNNPVAIFIAPLESATLSESNPQILEFTAPSGNAQSIVTAWLVKQKAEGWTVETTIDTKQTGDYLLSKGDQKIILSFIDPGFIPAEITIKTVAGFKIEVKK